ncbi:MAG: metal ABC transporter substrate-binding protein [Acidobacteriota bacterium]
MKSCALFVLLVLASGCAPVTAPTSGANSSGSKKTIVVTYSVLGAVVRDLAGDQANVVVPMPNGQDPHEWEPSAKDIETLNKADFIVQNGLGLEAGMGKTLAQARKSGVRFFTASDYIAVRKVGPDEGLPTGDPDQAAGAKDPHLWMDPLTIKLVVDALAVRLESDLGIAVADRARDLDSRLDTLNQELADQVRALPPANRRLVTGHESLGYFAQRYDFKLVGALIPNLSSQAQVSASELAALKKQIQDNQVKAIFVELGTPPAVASAISKETGVKVVPLTTHSLPSDGSYFTFMRNLARVVTDGLK